MKRLQLQGMHSLTVVELEPRAPRSPEQAKTVADADPGVVILDLDVSALGALEGRRPRLAGWSLAWADALGDAREIAASYAKIVEAAERVDSQVAPIDLDDDPGRRGRRRLRRTLADADGDGAAALVLARADEEVRAAITDRIDHLADATQRVLERELPRPVAVFTAPFGAEVARRVGPRMDMTPAGRSGWPE